MTGLVIYCADIGSVAEKNFGWARVDAGEGGEPRTGSSIGDLAVELADDLNAGRPTVLGFECPLWVPLPTDGEGLGKARPGEGSHAWSAGPGALVLTTGSTQIPWLLRAVREKAPGQSAFLSWGPFEEAGRGLFLWEAFISGEGKVGKAQAPAGENEHERDARIATEEFASVLADPEAANASVPEGDVQSLIGAAMLRTGWSMDIALLSQPCLVIKA